MELNNTIMVNTPDYCFKVDHDTAYEGLRTRGDVYLEEVQINLLYLRRDNHPEAKKYTDCLDAIHLAYVERINIFLFNKTQEYFIEALAIVNTLKNLRDTVLRLK